MSFQHHDSESETDDDFDPQELAAVADLHKNDSDDDDNDDQSEEAVLKANGYQGKGNKARINNKAGLDEKMEEIQYPKGVNWLETLIMTSPQPINGEDVHDDLKREANFYSVAMNGVKAGITQLQASGIPFERPADYFAEMVKTDAHMAKVKDVLLSEHKRIEAVAVRKRNAEHKKFAKKAHVAKLEERAAARRNKKEDTDHWKNKGKNDTSAGNGLHGNGPMFNKKGSLNDKEKPATKGKKRLAADAKFGKGGASNKKFRKNDSKSSLDAKFNAKQNKSTFHQWKKSESGSGNKFGSRGDGEVKHTRRNRTKKTTNRPGKARRAAAR